MMRLYKRVLAALLCLALMTAVMPAAVFAAKGETGEYEDGDFVPGELIITLCEQYYTVDDEMQKDLADILPEIEIDEYSDMYLSVLMVSPIPREQWKPHLVAMVGTTFHVKLAEKTAEAVETAIEALKGNPYVKYAEKNFYAYPDGPGVPDPDEEVTVADALAVLRVAAKLVTVTPDLTAKFDKDGDGIVTVADAMMVLRIAAKLA